MKHPTVNLMETTVHLELDLSRSQMRTVELVARGLYISLESYDIRAHSQVQLAICDDVYNNEMAKSFKAPTDEPEEQSPNGTRVLVKYLETGNVFPINIDISKPVRSLKEEIQKTGVFHFPPSTQVLLSRFSDRVLHEDKTLAHYAVKEDYTVGMVVCK